MVVLPWKLLSYQNIKVLNKQITSNMAASLKIVYKNTTKQANMNREDPQR